MKIDSNLLIQINDHQTNREKQGKDGNAERETNEEMKLRKTETHS